MTNVPALATRLVPARIGRVTYKRPMCAGCRAFERFAPGTVLAGAPMAHGRCTVARISKAAERQPRRETDWCDEFKRRGE